MISENAREIARRAESTLLEVIYGDSEAQLNERSQIAFPLWAACIENASGIRRVLTEPPSEPLYGPASTLIRSTYEMLTRGVWILWIADDDRVKEIRDKPEDDGRWPLDLASMAKQIVKYAPDLDGGWLDRFYSQLKHPLHSAAHGGVQHAERFLGTGTVGQNVDTDLLEEVLRAGMTLGILAGCWTCLAIGNESGAKALATELGRINGIADTEIAAIEADAEKMAESKRGASPD